MTHEETVMLCRYVKACCPQQAIDEFTPDAWSDLLGDLTLADCRGAVVAVARRQPFVAPAEIRAEVLAQRRDRLERNITEAPAPELTDDPVRYRAALAENIRSIADAKSLNRSLGTPKRDRPLAIAPSVREPQVPRALAAKVDAARAVLNDLEDFGAGLLERARTELGDVDMSALVVRAAEMAREESA